MDLFSGEYCLSQKPEHKGTDDGARRMIVSILLLVATCGLCVRVHETVPIQPDSAMPTGTIAGAPSETVNSAGNINYLVFPHYPGAIDDIVSGSKDPYHLILPAASPMRHACVPPGSTGRRCRETR
jgi:hypothetical protein